ncbi:hypothetical protein GCK72_016002 [Caenorhabditis remanei]|uniref:Uncharacterized protein n=1 Tax=Caenorhabditis remanei TaxID=31234 RepID=A0A6A5GYA3_CAERE|nr:hypothetical protein GCK72_016002 [Caenorhabditis remanei]KAF1759535.1 hypothetical protein GCK72_016002 [Caenorhabditis remanei]
MTTSPDRNLKEEIFQALKKENYELTCEVMANSTALAVKNGQVRKLNGQVKELNETVAQLNEREAKTQKLLHQFEKSEMGLQLEIINMRKEMDGKEANLMELNKEIKGLKDRAEIDSIGKLVEEMKQQTIRDEKLVKQFKVKYGQPKNEFFKDSPLDAMGLHKEIMERMAVQKELLNKEVNAKNPATELKLSKEERAELDRVAKIGENEQLKTQLRMVEKKLEENRDKMETMKMKYEIELKETNAHLADMVSIKDKKIAELQAKMEQTVTTNQCRMNQLFSEIQRREEKIQDLSHELQEAQAILSGFNSPKAPQPEGFQKETREEKLKNQLRTVRDEMKMMKMNYEKRLKMGDETNTQLVVVIKTQRTKLAELEVSSTVEIAPAVPQSDSEQFKNQLQMVQNEMEMMKMKYEERLKMGDKTNTRLIGIIKTQRTKLAELELQEITAALKDLKTEEIAPEARQPVDSDGEEWEHVEEADTA